MIIKRIFVLIFKKNIISAKIIDIEIKRLNLILFIYDEKTESNFILGAYFLKSQ
jgi:hypothetical protein